GAPRYHPLSLPTRGSTRSRFSSQRPPAPPPKEEETMDVLYPRCCGLDVHKNTVVACRIVPGPDGQPLKEIRTFGTTTHELLRLSDWLAEAGVTHVALESTGVIAQGAPGSRSITCWRR